MYGNIVPFLVVVFFGFLKLNVVVHWEAFLGQKDLFRKK